MLKLVICFILALITISLPLKSEPNYGSRLIAKEHTCEYGVDKVTRIEACAWVGYEYYQGSRVRFNYKLAKYYLGEACDGGHATSCHFYGRLLYIGKEREKIEPPSNGYTR